MPKVNNRTMPRILFPGLGTRRQSDGERMAMETTALYCLIPLSASRPFPPFLFLPTMGLHFVPQTFWTVAINGNHPQRRKWLSAYLGGPGYGQGTKKRCHQLAKHEPEAVKVVLGPLPWGKGWAAGPVLDSSAQVGRLLDETMLSGCKVFLLGTPGTSDILSSKSWKE